MTTVINAETARMLTNSYVMPVETIQDCVNSALNDITEAAKEGKGYVDLTNKNFPHEIKKILKGLGFLVSIFTEMDEYTMIIRKIEVKW